jgi:hypothetical protein
MATLAKRPAAIFITRMIGGPVHAMLSEDHARLDALLAQATDSDAIDPVAYAEFRGGLLRHIAMEEKVLFADVRARGAPELAALVKQLHADHAAIASLLVPPPTRELIATLRSVLAEHNPLEEGQGGLYDACDALVAEDAAAVISRMRGIPATRVSEHLDEPRIHEHIARMLAARRPRT